MLTRRMLVALAAIAMLSSSTVFAGGGNGGSKAEPIIKVRNDTAAPIAVFINPNQALIAQLPQPPAIPTQAQIEAAGGKLANTGQELTFKVKVGTYIIAAGDTAGGQAQTQQTTGKGGEYKFAFIGPGPFARY